MRPSLHVKFIEKAEAALVSAVEIYNKPLFRYREESFALLAINAWELLLKARLLKEKGNDPRAIRVYEPRRTKAGKLSKKLYLRKNRTGSPMTVSLSGCVVALDRQTTTRLSPEIKSNLDALLAIRDSAAHYIHASPVLAKHVLEIATASVKNFILLAKAWFDRDFSDSLSLMLPLSFINPGREAESVIVTRGESHLLKYLQGLAVMESDAESPYAVAVRVQVKLERSKLATASKVQVTNDPDAVKVVMTEQDIRDRYPWDYKTLSQKCGERYTNFKLSSTFHGLRKSLAGDARYTHSRFLDPGNPKSGRKEFYSPAILDVLDKHYARR